MIAQSMIVCGGVLSIVMALLHLRFPKMFDWKCEFEKIGRHHGKVHYSIHVALILLFFGIGILSLLYPGDFADAKGLGRGLCVMLSLFWLWRTLWQLTYFRLPKGPKPKGPVMMYYCMTALFVLLTVAYSYPIFAPIR